MDIDSYNTFQKYIQYRVYISTYFINYYILLTIFQNCCHFLYINRSCICYSSFFILFNPYYFIFWVWFSLHFFLSTTTCYYCFPYLYIILICWMQNALLHIFLKRIITYIMYKTETEYLMLRWRLCSSSSSLCSLCWSSFVSGVGRTTCSRLFALLPAPWLFPVWFTAVTSSMQLRKAC